MLMEMYGEVTSYFLAWSLLIGLVLGSFLNVIILRLPEIEDLVDDGMESGLPKTIMGRSYCPCCKAQIPIWLNVPVLSWAWLRGKSKCCGKPIHWRYPLVELATGFLSLCLMSYFGPTGEYLLAMTIGCLSICLMMIDFDHMVLPDKLTLSFLWSVLLGSVFGLFVTPESAIIGGAVGYGFIALIGFVFKYLKGKDGIGMGDAKLLAAVGALVGPFAVPGVMLGALVTFAFYAVTVGCRSDDSKYPLGPFIILGMCLWLVFGPYYGY